MVLFITIISKVTMFFFLVCKRATWVVFLCHVSFQSGNIFISYSSTIEENGDEGFMEENNTAPMKKSPTYKIGKTSVTEKELV